MKRSEASRTTQLPAVLRAAHQILDRPLIFRDPVAVGLIPEASEGSILEAADHLRSSKMLLLRALMVLRSRFVEDQLAAAAARGVRQYVIVGAGLDTFPWRQPPFARGMRIFAADHPASLAWTEERLRDRGLGHPPNLTFVPIDLERQGLVAQLAEYEFDRTETAFCSALGLSQYLTAQAFDVLLRSFASLQKGSEVSFTFVAPDDELDGDDLAEARSSGMRTKAKGEPWITRPPPQELVERLLHDGFGPVFHLTPVLAQERYFAHRQDGLRAPHWEQLIAASV
jgi:methyltransferase (TIGR00027 family)